MNKKYILTSLYKIANTLDNNGLYKEALSLTSVMKKIAQEDETPQKLSYICLKRVFLKISESRLLLLYLFCLCRRFRRKKLRSMINVLEMV
jgi:hypothetical protein